LRFTCPALERIKRHERDETNNKKEIHMDVITVAQALRKVDGEQIIAMSGKLIDTKKPFEGEKNGEAYKFQYGTLQDPKDAKAKIKIKVWGHDDLGPLKGQVIYLLSVRGEGKKANQWFGVKRVTDTYDGRNDPMVDCSGKTDITTADPGGAPEPETTRQRAPQGRQQAGAPKAGQQTRPAGNAPQGKPATLQDREKGYVEAVKETKLHLAKMANLYLLCLKAADRVLEEYNREHPEDHMSEDQYQACTSSFWIASKDKFLHGALPPGDLSKYLPAPKQQAEGQ
jgi:hypothetical protein